MKRGFAKVSGKYLTRILLSVPLPVRRQFFFSIHYTHKIEKAITGEVLFVNDIYVYNGQKMAFKGREALFCNNWNNVEYKRNLFSL